MAPTLSAFAKLDGAGLGEDDPMAFRVNGSIAIFRQYPAVLKLL
jgi:hypothetical protein